MYSRRNGNRWSDPKEALFLKQGDYNMSEPIFSHDGNSLYFVSNRPPGKLIWNVKIFTSQFDGDEFTLPVNVKITDEGKGTWFPYPAKDDSIYFGSSFNETVGKDDLYVVRKDNEGKYTRVENLGPNINSKETEWDPYLHPNQDRLLFVSDKPGGMGDVDIYMSNRGANGSWNKAINMGAPINSALFETASKFSPDGRFLFFQRIIEGKEVIYWVDFNKYLAKHNLS